MGVLANICMFFLACLVVDFLIHLISGKMFKW